MARLRPLRSFLAILAIALGAAVAASLLPTNPYQRWQQLDGTLHAKSRWIYERIHFDPRPIDVAVVGPSRTVRGVDARRLEASLAALGVPSRVVNFALPEGGRDTNDVIVEEMLTTKTPKLIIIGVIEKPSRFGHAAFKYLAPAPLVADPGYPTNLNYLKSLAYLPFRQMRLFVANVAPGTFGLTKRFDAARYTPDQTEDILFRQDSGIVRPASQPAPVEELESGIRALKARTRPPILPPELADLEFGDDRHYVRRIVEAARRKNVRVAFLYLPFYSGGPAIQEEPFYAQYGPVWNAAFVGPHPELYSDYAHLTTGGAARVNAWLAPQVAALLKDGRP
jgi:hypothetical protein